MLNAILNFGYDMSEMSINKFFIPNSEKFFTFKKNI